MSNHRLHARAATVLLLLIATLGVLRAQDNAPITITSDCVTASARVDGDGFYPVPVVAVERDALGCVIRMRVFYEVRRVRLPVVLNDD